MSSRPTRSPPGSLEELDLPAPEDHRTARQIATDPSEQGNATDGNEDSRPVGRRTSEGRSRRRQTNVLTPEQRILRARIAAYRLHATHDPKETTRKAREAFAERFERQVDPDGVLPPRRAGQTGRGRPARLLHPAGAVLLPCASQARLMPRPARARVEFRICAEARCRAVAHRLRRQSEGSERNRYGFVKSVQLRAMPSARR